MTDRVAPIFLEADLSQSESRMVFAFTGDPELVRLARLPSWEYDGHTENIVVVGLAKNMDEVRALKKSDPADYARKRYIGKKVSHGAQRDMHGGRLSSTLLLDGFSVSPEKCEEYITAYHRKRPGIRIWFSDIRKQIMRNKALVNSWGRRWDVRYERLGDDLFRQAYSFLPQSENADLLNQWGLLPLWRYFKMFPDQGALNLQVHDSLLCTVHWHSAYDVAEFMASQLERPRVYAGSSLSIPVEFKLGVNWGASERLNEGVEFKKLPSRKEFQDIAYALAEQRWKLNQELGRIE